jgi:hypothetical protein
METSANQFVHWFAFRNMKDELYRNEFDIFSAINNNNNLICSHAHNNEYKNKI